MTNTIQTQQFNDVSIHVIPYRDQPCFIAHEVAQALDYSNPKDFTRKISGDWSNEFTEGLDYFKVEGESLASLKALVTDPVTSRQGLVGESPTSQPIIHPNTPSLIVLTRDGVNLAAIKAQTEKGTEFRRWLASDLLPALQDGRLPEGFGGGAVPLQALVPLPTRRDTEAARLMMTGIKILSKDGALLPPERTLVVLEVMEMSTGEPNPRLRRGIARVFAQLAASPQAQQLPLFTDPDPATEDAA